MKTRAPRKDTPEQRKAWKAATKKNFEALPEEVKEARKQAIRDRVNASRVENREAIRQRAKELYAERYRDKAVEYARKKREERDCDPEKRKLALDGMKREWKRRRGRLPKMHNTLKAAKYRALNKGMEFSLTPEDLYTPETCPIFGTPLDYYASKRTGQSPSLDRIDNTKGYTPDNVWVISGKANTMKSNASFDELELFATKILEKVKEWRRDKR